MADEEAYAGLTDRIATAVAQTHGTLQSLADDLGDEHLGRVLDRRMEDLARLKPGINGVGAAEQAVDNAQGAAVDPAKQNLISTYRSYQVDAGNLSSLIGATQRDLDSQRDTLRRRADSLKDALRDIDAIQQLPGRATDDVAKLRDGVEYLRAVVDVVDQRVGQVGNQLADGRRSAVQFENSWPEIDGSHKHSAEIGAATGSIEGSIAEARSQVSDLHDVLNDRSAGFRSVAQFAIDVSNTALAEKQQAAADNAELTTAMRAGVNPTVRTDQHAVANQAESDLSRRLNGPAQEGGLKL
jgi:hypothetical protein